MKNAICSAMRPKADKVHFDLVNVHAQPNACDCGLYAIAYATELVHGCDPALCLFDNGDMRQHLLCCLEKGHLSCFPCTKKWRIPIGSKVKTTIEECIYCTCRRVNDKTRPMIECDNFYKWFHKDYENLDTEKSHKGARGICSLCTNALASFSSN